MNMRTKRILRDVVAYIRNPDSIPVVYFSGVANVGDLLNTYLIPKISGKNIYKAESSALPHLRAIGSVVGSANFNSYIWGSGSIDGRPPRWNVRGERIFALRGKLTMKVFNNLNLSINKIPLGDPAILMPRYYSPDVEKKYLIGIVPHFIDQTEFNKLIPELPNEIKFINVSQHPEKFVNDLLQCHYIISSSLHGLILSDSYKIPNVWVQFSDKIIGGKFKFYDYYTKVKISNICPLKISSKEDIFNYINNIKNISCVKESNTNLDDLIEAFPEKFIR